MYVGCAICGCYWSHVFFCYNTKPTPTDAAPEQLMHQEVSFAVDIFSFGVVMLELLMGQAAPTNRRYPTVTYVW